MYNTQPVTLLVVTPPGNLGTPSCSRSTVKTANQISPDSSFEATFSL